MDDALGFASGARSVEQEKGGLSIQPLHRTAGGLLGDGLMVPHVPSRLRGHLGLGHGWVLVQQHFLDLSNPRTPSDNFAERNMAKLHARDARLFCCALHLHSDFCTTCTSFEKELQFLFINTASTQVCSTFMYPRWDLIRLARSTSMLIVNPLFLQLFMSANALLLPVTWCRPTEHQTADIQRGC